MPPVRYRDVFQHRLATVTEPRCFDGDSLQDAANVVHHQGGQRFAIHVFSNDQQRAASLGNLFQHRQQVADVGDLLVVQQDVWIFHQGQLAILVVDEVGGKVAAIELHAFHDIQFIFQTLCHLQS